MRGKDYFLYCKQQEMSLLCHMAFKLLLSLYVWNSQVASELLLPVWLLPTLCHIYFSEAWCVIQEFPSYLPLHCLICLGLFILVLFPSGPQGFISCATFINVPFFLPFTKVIVKRNHSLAKPLLIEPFILTGNHL